MNRTHPTGSRPAGPTAGTTPAAARAPARVSAKAPAKASPRPRGTNGRSPALAAPPASPAAPADVVAGRLALRLADVAKLLGVSRRALERERSAGRFPRPDRTIGRMPLWSVETIRRWIEGVGRS